ncbi:unnamed protein product [Rodentolepis nana]|uniref:Tetraspanin n=1 Tax=Rodentolepis nana TaxID=102285 RepID=A0A0R3TD37_RODNA|nr:unnamed protein product [Rodentolepis nana]
MDQLVTLEDLRRQTLENSSSRVQPPRLCGGWHYDRIWYLPRGLGKIVQYDRCHNGLGGGILGHWLSDICHWFSWMFGSLEEEQMSPTTVLIIIVEIACGVILIVNKDKFKPFIREFFTNAIAEIESNPNSSLTVPIIELQDSLDCCGANGPSDWTNPVKYCCEPGEICVPTSLPGCVEKIAHELKAISIGIGASVVVLAIIEIETIVAALILAKQSE